MRILLAFSVSLVLHLLVLAFLIAPFLPDRLRHIQVKATVLSVALPVQSAFRNERPRSLATNAVAGVTTAPYYSPSAVDVRAAPIYMKPLVIPQQAYMERRRGRVRLRAYIDEFGNVRKIDILSAEPEGVYEQAVIDAVVATIFSPARYNGTAVKTYKELEINIDPYETISVP